MTIYHLLRHRAAQGDEISIHAPPRGATTRSSASGRSAIFQFTPLREGRPSCRLHRFGVRTFQFTPLREGRPRVDGRGSAGRHHFNSRPSARGDVKTGEEIRIAHDISIHAPPRGATRHTARNSGYTSFQFTPLREGRRAGATVTYQRDVLYIISIHAPPRGATNAFLAIVRNLIHFNSRPSARGDLKFRKEKNNEHISIHAPPRGATIQHRQSSGAMSIFQFTPLREGRPSARRSPRSFSRYFNSRPSARGDSKRYAISANLLFNPYKSAWLNNNATQFVEIILVIFHRIIA